MPSLMRFLTIVGLLVGSAYAVLYVLAVYLEPPQREVSRQLPSVKIKRP
jgi:hypothetical protein